MGRPPAPEPVDRQWYTPPSPDPSWSNGRLEGYGWYMALGLILFAVCAVITIVILGVALASGELPVPWDPPATTTR